MQPIHTPVTEHEPPSERDAPADAEAAFRREVERHLPRNFTAYLIHGLAAQTGFRLVQAPTFLPAYVFALSGSSAAPARGPRFTRWPVRRRLGRRARYSCCSRRVLDWRSMRGFPE